MFFWGTSEEVPKNTRHGKLSFHKKLPRRLVLGAGISYQGAAPGALSLLHTQACSQRLRQNVLTAGVMESALTPVNRLQGPSEASCHHPALRGRSFLLVQDFGTCPLPKDQTGLPPYCKDLPIYLDLPGKIIKSNGK